MSTHSDDFPTKISSSKLNRQIAQYSLAAAVAGVSAIALVAPAVGEIVVTNKTIPFKMSPAGTRKAVGLSLANNGINDLIFYFTNGGDSRSLVVDGANHRDGVIIGGTWDPYAKALARNTKIGPAKSSFWYAGLVELSASSADSRYCKGYFGSNLTHNFIGCGNPKDKYLGVRFRIDGQFHYGWVRLNISTVAEAHGPAMKASITAYAYETTPNKAILAGATSSTAMEEKPTAEVRVPEKIVSEQNRNQSGPSLGMLAAGSEALPIWRR